jgi:hypothetical protein
VKTSNSAPHHEKARTYPLGHAVKSMRDMTHLKGPPSGVLHDFGEPMLVLQPAVLWAILLIR